MNTWAKALGLGVELVGLVSAFLYAGQYFDEKYEWPGYGMTFGGLFGLIIWLAHVVMITKQFEKDEAKNPPNGTNP